MTATTKRKFNRLTRAIDQRNAHWLEHTEGEIYRALEAELADGASPEEVAAHVATLAGERDWFARKVQSAARYMAQEK